MLPVRGILLNPFCWLWLATCPIVHATTTSMAKPGCQTKCGNLTVLYPFGIGLDGSCSMNDHYNINCNTSFHPSKPFLGDGNLEIMDISESHMRIKNNFSLSYFFDSIVIDWVVDANQTCDQAQKGGSSYVCHQNTKCIDFNIGSGGYRCSCLPGYQGNPYLAPGCTDIDECAAPNNPCSHLCVNTPGSITCHCPKGYQGDGLKKGKGCNSSHLALELSLGLSFGFLLLLILIRWTYFTIARRNFLQIKERFFEHNRVLMKQLLSTTSANVESSNIFTADELKSATKNYSEDRVIGKGGYGTVYKGILKDGQEVAIKKSRIVDQTQIGQFINEVVMLTQINHRNVVKLLGCCLETEVPLLVYEFISNGTLFEQIRKNKGSAWLNWANCIRLASEAADALAYLHSAASIPIIHRDIKSSNILLDHNRTVKISDFGASRLIPIDQTQVTTLVQGTLGYLDPEYICTSQLTEKSDVYSFGVVLVELLTKEKPLTIQRKFPDMCFATYFDIALRENRLFEIIDPQLVREATKEQLVSIADITRKCLNVRGEYRPTMKELALTLEGLKKQIRQPGDDENYEDTAILLLGQQQDRLLLESSNKYNPSNTRLSAQYSLQAELLIEMSHPR